jgi:hypothetical protein
MKALWNQAPCPSSQTQMLSVRAVEAAVLLVAGYDTKRVPSSAAQVCNIIRSDTEYR